MRRVTDEPYSALLVPLDLFVCAGAALLLYGLVAVAAGQLHWSSLAGSRRLDTGGQTLRE